MNFDLDNFDFGTFDSLETGVNIQEQPIVTPDVSAIVTTLKKRAMIVFFIIDISGSMQGARIGAVNDAIRNIIPELRKRERGSTQAEIKLAIMEFSTKAKWKTTNPEPIATYKYSDIESVYGGTNYGYAFEALNEKLSARQFMANTAGAYAPLIILLTDGKPSDIGLYPYQLEQLKKNKWFNHSTRAGIAIEDGALSPECKKVLGEFTGNIANVYEARDSVKLAKQIELVTLTGVDLVTQQGSIQNTDATGTDTTVGIKQQTGTVQQDEELLGVLSATGELQPVDNKSTSSTINNSSTTTSIASPTLPLMSIDWENDFSF